MSSHWRPFTPCRLHPFLKRVYVALRCSREQPGCQHVERNGLILFPCGAAPLPQHPADGSCQFFPSRRIHVRHVPPILRLDPRIQLRLSHKLPQPFFDAIRHPPFELRPHLRSSCIVQHRIHVSLEHPQFHPHLLQPLRLVHERPPLPIRPNLHRYFHSFPASPPTRKPLSFPLIFPFFFPCSALCVPCRPPPYHPTPQPLFLNPQGPLPPPRPIRVVALSPPSSQPSGPRRSRQSLLHLTRQQRQHRLHLIPLLPPPTTSTPSSLTRTASPSTPCPYCSMTPRSASLASTTAIP